MSQDAAPAIAGIHHVSITVTDLEASLAWYEKVLGADRIPAKFPHYGREDTGHGEMVIEPRSGVAIGLHTNVGNDGARFDEARTGLDHVAFNVGSREDLKAWTAWLDELGIAHSGIQAVERGLPFATVVFRDPDNVQLELFTIGAD